MPCDDELPLDEVAPELLPLLVELAPEPLPDEALAFVSMKRPDCPLAAPVVPTAPEPDWRQPVSVIVPVCVVDGR